MYFFLEKTTKGTLEAQIAWCPLARDVKLWYDTAGKCQSYPHLQ